MLELSEAYHAVVEWPRLALLNVIAPVHPALVVGAMPDSEHVPDLMSHDFTCSIKHEVLTFLCRSDLITIELRTVAMETKDTSLSHHIGETENESEGLIRVDIFCCHCYNTDCSWILRFIDSEQPT